MDSCNDCRILLGEKSGWCVFSVMICEYDVNSIHVLMEFIDFVRKLGSVLWRVGCSYAVGVELGAMGKKNLTEIGCVVDSGWEEY